MQAAVCGQLNIISWARHQYYAYSIQLSFWKSNHMTSSTSFLQKLSATFNIVIKSLVYEVSELRAHELRFSSASVKYAAPPQRWSTSDLFHQSLVVKLCFHYLSIFVMLALSSHWDEGHWWWWTGRSLFSRRVYIVITERQRVATKQGLMFS